MDQLQEQFEEEALESIKHPSHYARNFIQYCSFRALELFIQAPNFLNDKKFRRLTFDMMIAWEVPSAASQPLPDVCVTINCLACRFFMALMDPFPSEFVFFENV